MKNKLSNKIMRDLAAAGFAEWDGDKDIYFWTATGRQEYAGNWRRVENYALELASQIERIYGPAATVGTPKDFGTVEIKLLDLPEVVQMVEAARQQAAAPTGREILSLYLAADNSNIVFDEPGRTATTANITGTIRQLIKWIRERTHNEKIRKQFAAELLAGAVFTFDDLAFAVYRSDDGFHCWNGTEESASFETVEDASAVMIDFISGTTEDDDLLFGVKRTDGGDYAVYLDGDYFDSTGELPAAAATLANWLFNEYKATPFGAGLFTPPTVGPHFYGIGSAVGGNWQIIDGEGESAGTFTTFTAALQAFFKLWKSRSYSVEADDGRLLLAGLYQNPPNEGGYTIAGAPVRGGGKREVNVYKAAAAVKLLADHVAEHAQHYPDPNGRVDLDIKTTGGAVFFGGQVMPFDGQFRVGADPASQRPDDMVIAANMAFSGGGGDRPEAARQVAGFYDFGDDGKTWFISSELPGHIGRFIYSSAPVAAERAGKILVDYLHSLGVPGVKAWPEAAAKPADWFDDPDLTGGGNMD